MPPRYRYEEIADDLQQRIKAGEFSPGSRLPSRRELIAHCPPSVASGEAKRTAGLHTHPQQVHRGSPDAGPRLSGSDGPVTSAEFTAG